MDSPPDQEINEMTFKYSVFVALFAVSVINTAHAFDHNAQYPIGCPTDFDGLPEGDYHGTFSACKIDQDELYCEGWKGGDCSERLGHSYLEHADRCEFVSVKGQYGKTPFQNDPFPDGSRPSPQLYCVKWKK